MNTKPLNPEDALIDKAVKRDRTAFIALYDRYVNQVYRHVFFLVPSQADAEDITQEVFIRAWKSIDRYKRTGAPFIAWLTAITRNLVTDHYRAKRKFVSLEEVEIVSHATETDPEAMTEASLNRNNIRKAVMKLKDEKKKVILMRYIDGMSYKDIAKAIHKNEGAVRVIHYRALKELKRIIADSK